MTTFSNCTVTYMVDIPDKIAKKYSYKLDVSQTKLNTQDTNFVAGRTINSAQCQSSELYVNSARNFACTTPKLNDTT